MQMAQFLVRYVLISAQYHHLVTYITLETVPFAYLIIQYYRYSGIKDGRYQAQDIIQRIIHNLDEKAIKECNQNTDILLIDEVFSAFVLDLIEVRVGH